MTFFANCLLDNMHEMSNLIFWENISKCHLLNFFPGMLYISINSPSAREELTTFHSLTPEWQGGANMSKKTGYIAISQHFATGEWEGKTKIIIIIRKKWLSKKKFFVTKLKGDNQSKLISPFFIQIKFELLC